MSLSGNAVPNKGTVLFRRRMSRNSSAGESSDELWDDRILTDVYDKAVNVTREIVAKRLAMNTNSGKYDAKLNKKQNHSGKASSSTNLSKTKWKVGSECRAVYSQDGLEYEATIIYIDGDNCIVSYVGYNNEEDVKISDLKPSLGKNERIKQGLDAEQINSDDNCETQSVNDFSNVEIKEGETNHIKIHNSNKSKSNKKKKNAQNTHSLPSLSSFQFPQFSMPNDLSCNVPLPPPPPFLIPNGDDSFQDDQSLSAMLISWYMSGYYTGLYQGQKMRRQK